MSSKLTPKYNYLTKRVFDLFLSVVLLLILSPLLIFVAAFVAIDLGFPIFFRQKRPGFKGEIFTIYKFRTMRDSKDAQGKLLSDKSRLTKFGRFLRATSLDELPELFNILKGEMSLVGPRPLLIEYLPRYNAHQSRRHDVLPGMTGWAQIHGRNDITWKEKFDLDVWYVDHWSFWLDLKIIGLTIIKVLRREGISQPGQATAELFLGNTEEEQQQINRDEP
jgi:lipopolysaccharide/colanic/teichoic acid biosynthesis glycosyltransferase